MSCHNPDGRVKGGGLWGFQRVCCYVALILWLKYCKIYHFRLIFDFFFQFWTCIYTKIFRKSTLNDIVTSHGWIPKTVFRIAPTIFENEIKPRVWREFDASLTRVWCEFDHHYVGASLVRVWCEFGASLARVWCGFDWCEFDARMTQGRCALGVRLRDG